MALWSTVQGEAFGSISSNYIGKYVFKKYSIKLTFDRFNFSLVPLSTSLINFKVENKDVRVELDELKISFGLRDLISKNISIGEVEIRDGVFVNRFGAIGDGAQPIEDIGQLYLDLDKTYKSKIPVKIRTLSVRNIIILHDKKVIDVNKMKIVRFSDSFNIEGENTLKGVVYKSYLGEALRSVNLDGVKYRLKLSKNGVKIENLLLKNKGDYVSVSGEVQSDKKIKKVFFDAGLDLINYKKSIRSLLGDEKLNLMGQAKVKGVVSGKLNNINANIDIDVKNIISKFIKIKNGKANILFRNNQLVVEKASGEIGGGTFDLVEKFTLVNLDKDKNKVSADMLLDFENVFSNDALVFVKELSDLDFYVTGRSFVAINDKRVKLDIKNDNKFKKLSFGKSQLKPLFKINEGLLREGSSIIARYKGKTDLDLELSFKESEVKVDGWIGKSNIDINYVSSQLSFEDVGPIAGVKLTGVGRLNGRAKGPIENIIFSNSIIKQDAGILGFNLSNIIASFDYYLKSNELRIKSLSGKYNTTKYLATGLFNFGTEERFNLEVDISKGRYADLAHILAPILKEVKKTTDKFQLKSFVDARASIRGPFSLSKIIANGDVKASELSIYGEDVEYIKTPFVFENNVAKFDKITGKKTSGNIKAEVKYNIENKSYSYKAELSAMRFRDFYYYRLSNLGLDGYLKFNTSGMGDTTTFSSKNTFSIEESQIDNVKIDDSLVTFYNNNEDIFFNGDLVGGEVKADGYINLNKNNKKRSNIKISANTKRINEYLGILSLHNINKRNLMGSVAFSSVADFNVSDLSDMNFKTVITNAYFNYADIVLKKKKDDLILEIEKGKVKEWNAELLGKSASIKSLGNGRWGKDFSIKTDFNLSASIFELASDVVENARGKIKGELQISEEDNVFSTTALLSGDDLKLKLLGVRGVLSDGQFLANIENNKLKLLKSSLSYGNGNIKTKGLVDFKIPFPLLDFESTLDRVALPILKKSNVTVSGNLKFVGERYPYNLIGKIDVVDGNILEGMQELAASAATAEGYKRFLPVGYSKGGASPLLLNVDTKIKSPIIIKNGMIDIGLAGEVNIFGTLLNPSFNGDLNVVGQESKLIFKGHEFFLQSGEIRLLDNRSKEKPELDFTGVARVNEYSIFVTINGAADKLAIELNSTPSLSQEDIVSLLTLGVTSDVSKNLTEGEMQSVTNLSIGSLIVDQLKINQTLNDSLGLRLSVQPEFQENEDNLLGGRSEDSSNERRLKSTTRVKVYKKINKNVNMSISSTLGGTVDQTQEMNINYKVNSNFSLEGIYQKQAGEEVDAETPDSIGADLKWQWFF